MTAEVGHHANRVYIDQDGALHFNGAAVYDSAENDIGPELDLLNALTDELALLSGVTASAAELNIMDGCTATAAELNKNAGVTAGTVTASKTVVVDANKDIASFRDVTVRQLVNTANVGAAAGTGVVATEYGDGHRHVTLLTLTNTTIALTDEAGVVAYGGQKVYDFPTGVILFEAAVLDLALTKSSAGVNADWDGDVGLGTATAGNNNALATTEQDLVPTTATPQAVAGATTADGQSTSTEACKVFNGTGTAVDAFLNLLVDDADHDVTGTPCNLIANGTIRIVWTFAGDN